MIGMEGQLKTLSMRVSGHQLQAVHGAVQGPGSRNSRSFHHQETQLRHNCKQKHQCIPSRLHVPTDGLLGWWALDGNAVCEIGGIDDGLVAGPTPTENRFGFEASAFRFDGNDRIEISDQTELRPESFTVSIWAWVDASNGQTQQFVAKNAGNGPYESVDVVRRNDNSVMCNIGGPDFWGTWLYDSSNEFPPSQWNHIVYCFDDSLNHQFLYQNGALIDSGSVSESIEYDSLPWTLGAERENEIFSWWLVGRLDDFGLWDRVLSSDEVSELFNWTPIVGCTDATACNFNADAMVDDGSCYSCDIPASHCGPGTIWDAEMQMCVGDGSGDINLDGCVQLNDLLDLLSAYGDCGAEESPWQCGDPLEFHGYDYETVQIGEQCWFAENCRFLPEVYSSENGSDTIPRAYVLNYDGEDLGVAAAEEYLLEALYNYPATSFWELCPADWHVGNDFDWALLESFASLPDSWPTSRVGGVPTADLKSTQWDGNDSLGFGINAHGYRDIYSSDTYWGEVGILLLSGREHTRFFQTDFQGVLRETEEPSYGFSVRCIKDAE